MLWAGNTAWLFYGQFIRSHLICKGTWQHWSMFFFFFFVCLMQVLLFGWLRKDGQEHLVRPPWLPMSAIFVLKSSVLNVLLVLRAHSAQLPRESSTFALSKDFYVKKERVLLCFISLYILNKIIQRLLICNLQIILITSCILIHYDRQNVLY